METYEITPAVDAVREFLEIAGDFTNPLEVIREAISNAIDAGASEIKINFSQPKAVGGYVLTITIEDDGRGMDAQDLQSFFDLGNSAKRHDPNLIGEKGHGTKVYFNCGSIIVGTTRDGVTLTADMDQPFSNLHDGKLPRANVTRASTPAAAPGTKITIKGFNNNQGELFTHDRLRDYINWFTKFGSFERTFGYEDHTQKVILLKGLDVTQPERIEFGHFFPEESPPIGELFNTHVVRAPDYYCKKIIHRGTLTHYPSIHYDAVFYIEGNRVKQSYNRMLRRQGYNPPKGGYTVQERYGIWMCKDFIPIERKNEWIASKGSEFTKFHAFFNCQDLSLTANRGSIANTPPAILADIREEVQSIYQHIIASDYWRDMDWLESEANAYLTSEKEKRDFIWRQDRAVKANIARFKDVILVEPSRESGVYALLIQLATLQPDLFPFTIVDYDTHSGIDVIAKMRDITPTGNSTLYYVELKYFFESVMNHSFENMGYIVCWDTAVKHGSKVTDLASVERTLFVAPADPKEGNYTGYFLRQNFKQDIQIFVLKDYLREKLGIEFRPRTVVEAAAAKAGRAAV
jgi:hypothetical protein